MWGATVHFWATRWYGTATVKILILSPKKVYPALTSGRDLYNRITTERPLRIFAVIPLSLSTFSSTFKLFSVLPSGFPLHYILLKLLLPEWPMMFIISGHFPTRLAEFPLASVTQHFFVLLLLLWLLLSTLSRFYSDCLFDFLEYKFHENRACVCWHLYS